MTESEEIAVTSEMIEAGVIALRSWSDQLKNWEGSYDSKIVEAVINAALSGKMVYGRTSVALIEDLNTVSTQHFRDWGPDRGMGEAGALSFCEALQNRGFIFVRPNGE